MSRIDDVFGPIPGPLIQEWGQSVTLVRSTGPGAYDVNTGEVTEAITRVAIKAVITKLTPKEAQGNYQTTDIKVMFDPGQIGNAYLTTQDYFEIPYAGGTQHAKVVDITTYRGDNPVFFVCIARPQ